MDQQQEVKEAFLENILMERAKQNNGQIPENPEDVLNNLTPAQLEMLTNLYKNDPKVKEEIKKNTIIFMPEPGFVLKTKTAEKSEKVFLNICQSPEVAAPKDITEEELVNLIEKMESENAAFHYRVPMSLGEPHTELDNSAIACTAYDICINPAFVKKITEKPTFMGFFVSIVIEGLESKFNKKLDRNCKMLKNKKFMGRITEQSIRAQSKPLISVVDDEQKSGENKDLDAAEKAAKLDEIKRKTPKYKIVREPAEGTVEFLVAEIEIPNIISAKSLTLDIGEDRILLSTRSGVYHLDIYLPYNLNQDECGAQFDKQTKVLSITMPVVSV